MLTVVINSILAKSEFEELKRQKRLNTQIREWRDINIILSMIPSNSQQQIK